MIALSILLVLSLSIEISFTQFPSKTFSCDNGEYIESNQHCDGYRQCSDGSDEPTICDSTRRVCGPGKYLCPKSRLCVDADLTSDVHILNYCPDNGNQSNSNETANFLSIITTVGEIFTRATKRQEGKFYCTAERCLNVHFVCEGYCDCTECSEEDVISIDEETINDVANCSDFENNFLCNDNKRCLNLEYVCDGYCNCFDCSDENGDCSKVDNEKLFKCPHSYFPTPLGPRCLETSLYHHTDNRFFNTYIEIANHLQQCTNEHICDQKCILFRRRAICSCFDDYIKLPNGNGGFRCQSNVSSQDLLVYSTTSQIKLLNLSTGEDALIKKSVESAALAAAHDYIYYSTYSNSNRIIFKHSFSSKKTTEIKLNNILDSTSINSIAIDYITDNFYFTTNTTLSVCSNDAKNRICMLVICCNVNYVALAPNYGWMFYTKASSLPDERLIMRSNMDGSEEEILVDGSFRFSTFLAIDESIKRLYWLDFELGNEKLLSASFYGGVNEIRKFQYTGNIVSISALDSRLFFTKIRDNQIYILENKENFTKSIEENAKITRYHSNFDSTGLQLPTFNFGQSLFEGNLTFSVQQLHAYNPIYQQNHKNKNPCAGLKTPCTGLCLLRSADSINSLGYACVCNSSSLTTNPYWCGIYVPRVPEKSSEVSSAPLMKSHHQSITLQQPSNYLDSKEPEHQNVHTGLKIFGAIILVALMLGVVYMAYNKWKQHDLSFAPHRSNDQINLYDQNEL